MRPDLALVESGVAPSQKCPRFRGKIISPQGKPGRDRDSESTPPAKQACTANPMKPVRTNFREGQIYGRHWAGCFGKRLGAVVSRFITIICKDRRMLNAVPFVAVPEFPVNSRSYLELTFVYINDISATCAPRVQPQSGDKARTHLKPDHVII